MRTVVISLDQLYRAQPGGIGSYVRGLTSALAELDGTDRVLGLAPRSKVAPVLDVDIARHNAALPLSVLTRLWHRVPVGVPRDADVVHAPSIAGPWGGGKRGAVHSVALHDLLWRDEPGASTSHGIRFHEKRLQALKHRADVRVFLSAPDLLPRLVDDGFDPARLFEVRLGVDSVGAESRENVAAFLRTHGVIGPYTLFVGTREPRKNLERLQLAHERVFREHPEVGPLVYVGSSGWGSLDTAKAVVIGVVSPSMLQGLYRGSSVVAYVPRAEGWGLPPVEGLSQGARVLASTTTPSVMGNREVVRVEPLDVDAIAEGLVEALSLETSEAAVLRRQASVAEFTWHNAALDHLKGWQ